MNTYKFTSAKGKWQLDFPHIDMAIYHAKLNHANCYLDITCICEWMDNGIGGLTFVKHI